MDGVGMTPEETLATALEVRHGTTKTWSAEIIKALEAAGYVIVPKEPTLEMLGAGWDAYADDLTMHELRYVWNAMLAALKREKPAPR